MHSETPKLGVSTSFINHPIFRIVLYVLTNAFHFIIRVNNMIISVVATLDQVSMILFLSYKYV